MWKLMYKVSSGNQDEFESGSPVYTVNKLSTGYLKVSLIYKYLCPPFSHTFAPCLEMF